VLRIYGHPRGETNTEFAYLGHINLLAFRKAGGKRNARTELQLKLYKTTAPFQRDYRYARHLLSVKALSVKASYKRDPIYEMLCKNKKIKGMMTGRERGMFGGEVADLILCVFKTPEDETVPRTVELSDLRFFEPFYFLNHFVLLNAELPSMFIEECMLNKFVHSL